jgi:predicted Zn-dependent peptidase
MVRLYIAFGILLFMASAAYGAYYYYNDTQERLAILHENNAKLETATKAKDAMIDALEATQEELEAINSQLALDLQSATDYTDELRKKLQEHDLTRLSLKKPGMIEKRVNDGTKDIISELESITSQ